MELRLEGDEVRMAANAVNWCLHVTFSKSTPPVFDSMERTRLESIFVALANAASSGGLFVVGADEPLYGALVMDCIEAFHREIGHSPFEVAAVTGLPISVLESLMGRRS